MIFTRTYDCGIFLHRFSGKEFKSATTIKYNPVQNLYYRESYDCVEVPVLFPSPTSVAPSPHPCHHPPTPVASIQTSVCWSLFRQELGPLTLSRANPAAAPGSRYHAYLFLHIAFSTVKSTVLLFQSKHMSNCLLFPSSFGSVSPSSS